MMAFLASTGGRGFRGLVSTSKTSPKTLLGRSSLNSSASLLWAGQRFISSSSGRRNSATETTSNNAFTPPPPPSTPEEKEALKKLYEEMQKFRDELMSELSVEDPFKAQELPYDFGIDENDLTDEQKVLNAEMDRMFTGMNTSKNILRPELMMEIFGESDPLKVDLHSLWYDIQRSKDLADNEVLDDENNIITFHPPHTLNETNSFVDNCGNRRHLDDAAPEDCFDDEGEVIPEIQAHFLAKHKVQPDFYPKKRDFSKLKEISAWNDYHDAEQQGLDATDFHMDRILEQEWKRAVAEAEAKGEEGSTDENETTEADMDDRIANDDEADQELAGEDEELGLEELDEDDEPLVDGFGFTKEEREIMEESFIPGYEPITQEYLDELEKAMDEEDQDDAEEIEAEQDGSEERSASQNDDEFSDDGTFELNKFITDRKIVVGNDSAAVSSANNSASANDEEQMQEFARIANRLSQTFVRSLTEPDFRAEVSPFVKNAEKESSSSSSSKTPNQSFDADFDEFVKKN